MASVAPGRRCRWWAWAIGMVLGAVMGSALAVTVQDDRGRAVTVGDAPTRVVSLLPSLTESVCALGACERLVGVDRYANWPASVTRLPRVGGGLDPHIEAVVALRPDLVLMAGSARGQERLQALGIPVLLLEPKTHADIERTLRVLAQVLGLPAARAEAVWADMQVQLRDVASGLKPSVRDARVYIEVSTAPHAAGEASFLGETLTRLGPRNIVGAALGPFPQINPEWVVRAQPDFILVADSHLSSLLARPGWRELAAVRSKRVCTFSPAESDVLVRPGPRLGDAARLIARCLQGAP